MECDTSDKSAGRKCGFQSLLHGYTNETRETPLALRAWRTNGARAIGNLFERHDAHGNPKNIQIKEISQTEQRMDGRRATRPGWNSAESEMRRLGRATKGVAEKMKDFTALKCVKCCLVTLS